MPLNIEQCDCKTLREYLLSTASLQELGARTEQQLQLSDDYVTAKAHVVDNQKKIAFWDGLRNYSGLTAGLMTGMLGGAMQSLLGGQADFSSTISNPTVVVSGAGVAGLTGLSIYSNYRSSLLWNENNVTNNEASSRKQAEMGKIHAHNNHELSLAASEYTAQRVGAEVEKAMERSFARHQTPSPCITNIHTIATNQSALGMGRT